MRSVICVCLLVLVGAFSPAFAGGGGKGKGKGKDKGGGSGGSGGGGTSGGTSLQLSDMATCEISIKAAKPLCLYFFPCPSVGAMVCNRTYDVPAAGLLAWNYTVSGQPGMQVAISIPTKTRLENKGSHVYAYTKETIYRDDWNPLSRNWTLLTQNVFTLPSDGDIHFWSGYKIVTGNDVRPGIYRGDFNVQVAYLL